MNSLFYLLIRLAFVEYLADSLHSVLSGESEGAVHSFEWNQGSQIFGLLSSPFFSETGRVSPATKRNILFAIIAEMNSGIQQFVENISLETPFDKKSKVVSLALERVCIELRDLQFVLVRRLSSLVNTTYPGNRAIDRVHQQSDTLSEGEPTDTGSVNSGCFEGSQAGVWEGYCYLHQPDRNTFLCQKGIVVVLPQKLL